MKEKNKMPRLERQLRLYEVVCQLVTVQFSNVCEEIDDDFVDGTW